MHYREKVREEDELDFGKLRYDRYIGGAPADRCFGRVHHDPEQKTRKIDLRLWMCKLCRERYVSQEMKKASVIPKLSF